MRKSHPFRHEKCHFQGEMCIRDRPFTAAGEKKAEAQPQDKAEPAAPAEDDPFEDIFKIFNRGK